MDLDFDRLAKLLLVAGQKIRAEGFDWFGPDDIGDMPGNRPRTYAVTKVRRLQKTRRPAAYLSRSDFHFATTCGDLEVGIYIPRGYTRLKAGEVDEKVARAFRAAGFKRAWPHPDAPGAIQVLVVAFKKRARPRAKTGSRKS